MEAERILLKSAISAFQIPFVGESSEMLPLLWNHVSGTVSQVPIPHDRKRKEENYVEGTFMFIFGLEACVTTVAGNW